MIDGYAGCETCPLFHGTPVPGHGPKNGLVIIGEAPGAQEVVDGKPFVGKSGMLLRQTLMGLGLNPEQDVYFTNACLCHPDFNETPNWQAIQCCRQRLVDELNEVQPTKILTVGAIGLSSLLNSKSVAITKLRGQGMSVEGRYTVGTYHPAAVLRDDDIYRDFVGDMIKWLTHDGVIEMPRPDVIIPTTPEEALGILLALHSASVVSCDLETEGFDFRRDKIFSIGFGALYEDGIHGVSLIIPIAIADQIKKYIISFLAEYKGSMVFHNGKFDMQFLMEWADDVFLWPKQFEDTMLMQYTLDERGHGSGGRSYKTLGLKDQARTRYDIPDYHFDFEKFLKLPEEERPYGELFKYQGLDCFITLRLREDLLTDMLDESELLWTSVCQRILFPGARFVARMEYHGFPIDVEYFEGLDQQLLGELRAIEERMSEICKAHDIEPPTNWRSHVQVKKAREQLGVKIASGTEREVIMLEMRKAKYAPDVKEFIQLGLDYSQKSALRQNYVRGVLDRVGTDGRIRPDFALQGADTSRLSCRDPNLQNIPTLVGPVIRRGYVAPPGWILAEIDYSQLELRVAAYYSRDEQMMEAFVRGDDIHRLVASDVFEKPPEQVTKLERYMAKYVDFGIIYGRSPYSLANGWEMEYVVEQGGKPWTVDDAERFVKKFLDGMSGLRDWIKKQHKLVRERHYTETPVGRRRRFPLIVPTDLSSVGHIERQSVNTPIQSLASDICLFNGIVLDRSLDHKDAYLVSIVHDALYALVREEVAEERIEYMIHTMETSTPVPFDVPLVVEAKVGTRWGELEEFEQWRSQRHTKLTSPAGG